jgi:MFS family permease
LGGLHALIAFSGLQAVALAALGFTEGLIALYVLAALFGLGFGGVFPVYTVIVREHLPSIEAGRWTGIVFMFGATGMGIGSWIGGVMFDMTGTYLWAFLVGVGFNVVNLLIILAIRPRTAPPGLDDFASRPVARARRARRRDASEILRQPDYSVPAARPSSDPGGRLTR